MSAEETLITLTADIVAAHVSNSSVGINDLPGLIANVHGALASLSEPAVAEEVKPEPAVSVRASIKPDYIVCLEDGKKLRVGTGLPGPGRPKGSQDRVTRTIKEAIEIAASPIPGRSSMLNCPGEKWVPPASGASNHRVKTSRVSRRFLRTRDRRLLRERDRRTRRGTREERATAGVLRFFVVGRIGHGRSPSANIRGRAGVTP